MTTTSSSELKAADLIQEPRVHRRVYTDPEIFSQEMRNIFGRTWIYVAHDSEIANPGDFVTRHIGLQPVIVSRDDKGQVHVVANRCAHRGALVCRELQGNAARFRCPYHGWVFAGDGRLQRVPMSQRYSESMDPVEFGLAPAPRVESYRGLIFASLSKDVPSLDEHLGPASRQIDMMLDRADDGKIDVNCGCNKHRFAGNWKLQADNALDDYHVPFVHGAAIRAEKVGAPQQESAEKAPVAYSNIEGWVESYGNGHGALVRRSENLAPDALRSRFPEWVAKMEKRHPIEEMLTLRQNPVYIFPNLVMRPDHIRVIQPRAVNNTEVLMYPYRLVGAPDAVNLNRLRANEMRMSAAGFLSSDDIALFDEVQDAMQSEMMDWVYFGRGLHDEKVQGNGVRMSADSSDETTMRGMFREWKRMMSRS